MLSNNIACKVANTETITLDKNPQSDNSSDERRTFTNSEPFRKSSQEHDEAISKGHNQEFPRNADKGIFFPWKKEKTWGKVYRLV